MMQEWKMPNVTEYDYGKPPSVWWCVIALAVLLPLGILITVLTWQQGQPVLSRQFFMRSLVLPLLAWGGVCGLIYFEYEIWIRRVDYWNWMCEYIHAIWRHWAQEHLVILRSFVLTPEAELAERLLGLDGSVPMNPDKIMALPYSAAQVGVSRAEHVFEQLLVPLADDILRVAQAKLLDVVLQSADAGQLTELRAVWRRLKLPDRVNIRMAPPDANAANGAMIGEWFGDRGMPEFVLLLACQLHKDGTEPSCSEVAVAMLLASEAAAKPYGGKLKPLARLFRPIVSTSDEVFESLTALLAGKQTPDGRIRHLWLSRLPRAARHVTVAAVQDAGLRLSVHDVDHAIGKPGPVNALLLQALAAQMVEYGQGVQLLASASEQYLMLNLVGAHVTPFARIEWRYHPSVLHSISVGVVCLVTFSMVLMDILGTENPWCYRLAMCVLLLLLPIQIGGLFLARRRVEADFFARLRH